MSDRGIQGDRVLQWHKEDVYVGLTGGAQVLTEKTQGMTWKDKEFIYGQGFSYPVV